MSSHDQQLSTVGPLPQFIWAIPLVLIVATGMLALRKHETERTTAVVKAATASSRKPPVTEATHQSRTQSELSKRWDELIRARKFDWGEIFAALEQSDRPDIELLEFRPDRRGETVQLRGEAKDAEALASYVETLRRQPAFATAHTTKIEKMSHNSLETIGFEVKSQLK